MLLFAFIAGGMVWAATVAADAVAMLDDRTHRSLHDLLAGTWVVMAEPASAGARSDEPSAPGGPLGTPA